MPLPYLEPGALRAAVAGDPFWSASLDALLAADPAPRALHLAILVEPYLGLILAGQKRIEARFSLQRRAPFEQVHPDDVLLLKRSGGPILGIGRVGGVRCLTLAPGDLDDLRARYADELQVNDPGFWRQRATARYATLIWMNQVRPTAPLWVSKRDRRAWVVLRARGAPGAQVGACAAVSLPPKSCSEPRCR